MPPASSPDSPAPARAGNFRWVICALLLAATTINYLDRSTLNVLAGTLQKKIGWNDVEYGDINAAFNLAYGLGFLILGWLVDRLGTRLGYAVSLAFWSLAAAGHALAHSAFGFGAARFLLGLGEAGNFPSSVKAVAEWFPRRQRALATGIFMAGTNLGAVMAPLLVPWLTDTWGWQAAFAATGLAGLIWIAVWLPVYRKPEEHPRVGAAELALIQSDREEEAPHVRWAALVPHRQTWAIALVKFLTDPIWWFYLFWSGKIIQERFNVDLKSIGLPLICIYVLADVGSIFGGWFSSMLIRRGWTVNLSRKAAMLFCAVAVLPVVYVPAAKDLWTAVLLLGLGAACHQGFAANVFTLASDMFPRQAVGSVTGLGGMAGALGGFLFQMAVGRIKEATGSHQIVFIIACSIYLVSVVLMQLLAPRCERVEVE
jgi:MFS transporter, ACS family, hexuronate transporter